jgi:DNA helicase-2/ATP-dependent DNA helicase PcrA
VGDAVDSQPFPGPAALGRGLVISADSTIPDAAAGWSRIVVDEDTLAKPDDALAELAGTWHHREPSVVVLGVPLTSLKRPESSELPPYELAPEFTFKRERLHFLVWANRYDGREGADVPPRWPHIRRAHALGAASQPSVQTGLQADVVLPDGTPAWVDGGPRTDRLDLPDDSVLVHVNQLWSGSLVPDRCRDPEDQLAPDQFAAVRHSGGAARVLAPAGSGKTRVLTARLRHLVGDRGWTPRSVMALAYNSRAAAEMRQRTSDLANAQVRTLHSLGYEILGRALGGRPEVLNERDVRRHLEGLVQVRHRANDDVYAPYLEALAEVRAALRSPEAVEDARGDVAGFAEMFAAYRDRLARQRAIDHDEQIYGAVEVLLRDPEIRREMQLRCAHVLLDELQDLTPAQLLMVRLLAAPAYDVYGVGDDDQVIYGYAGADPRFLVDYDSYFPEPASYLLDVNYRCPPPVVDAVSKLLVNNRIRVSKTTVAAPRPGDGSEQDDAAEAGLAVVRAPEAEMGERLMAVVRGILDGGADPSDVAILTRVNAALLAPQVLLAEDGVSVQAAVDERMLDRTGIQAALAWLRLAEAVRDRRPLDGQDLGVAARRPPRKLNRGVLGALGRGDWTVRRLDGFARQADQRGTRIGLEELALDVDRIGRLASAGRPTAELLTELRDSVGLGGALEQLDGGRSSPKGGHTDDLDALILVARARPELTEFEPWLRQTLRRPSQVDGGPRGAGDGAPGEGVVLSTVHRVKGLEWPHVIVWDASDGVMPHHLNRTGDELEEERRVFHVALTRGQESVSVVTRRGLESPFVAEMAGKRSPIPATPPTETKAQIGSARRENGSSSKPLDAVAQQRAEALKVWRRERSQSDEVPAYIVLNDRHLEGIAERAPTTLDQLARCEGIGPTKLDRYGDDILSVLRSPSPKPEPKRAPGWSSSDHPGSDFGSGLLLAESGEVQEREGGEAGEDAGGGLL